MTNTTMINVFSYDSDQYAIEEIAKMVDQMKEIIPPEDTLIAIPKHCDFYHDVPIETLYYYRKMFDDIIEERQRRNMDKHDL